MNEMESDFTPQESLRLISSMIEKTKNAITDNSFYFLLWGWVVFIACLGQYCMQALQYPNAGYIWLVIPLAFVVQVFYTIRQKKKQKVRSFVGDAYNYLWTALGISFFVLVFIFNKTGWEYCSAFYILLYAVGTYVSGRLIRFMPLAIGGMACFPLAMITVYLRPDQQALVLALAILISYIIPGHLLRSKHRKQTLHV